MDSIKKKAGFNLEDYNREVKTFSWEKLKDELQPVFDLKGYNIGFIAVDRQAEGELKYKTALRFIGKDKSKEDITYAELKKLTSKFANVLEYLELEKGESVFSFTPRIPELYIAALGTLKFLGVFCPLFSVFGPEPVFQRLSRGNAKVLLTTSSLYEKKIKQLEKRLPNLEYILLADAKEDISEKALSFSRLLENASEEFDIPATEPEDPALLHFTSGTTGMPKGALHVHKAVLTHYITGKFVLDFKPGDTFWCTADPGWVTGTSYGIISPLVNGVTNVVDTEEFDAMRWYGILEEQNINIWYTAPTAIRRLMRLDIKPKDAYNIENLRAILSVGEPLHAEAVLWGKENFDLPILDSWWQTETGGIMISNYPSMEIKAGSMGKPLPGVEAKIAEISNGKIKILGSGVQGQLVLKKGWPSMFRAYLHDETRYSKCFIDDWYITGDLAKKDEDGYFWFIGRADDIIKTSGHMVGPFEVESCLMKHPAVAEAAVIGKPEPSIGELVKAFIVLSKGKEASEKLNLEIIGFARKEMGPAVAPKEIEFVNSVPKTRSGKILRRLLKARELGLPEGDISTLEKN